MVRRVALAKTTAMGVLAVLLIAGAAEIYYYTSAPTRGTANKGTSSSTNAASTASQIGESESGPGGSCTMNAQGQCTQPSGAWADYLGYIPAGYTLAPVYPTSEAYPCPTGMDAAQCAVFRQSCGNGVCDPNESCETCPIDCGVPSGMTCNPYTGRPAAPVAVCQGSTIQ